MAITGTVDPRLLKTYHWINGKLVGKNMDGTWDDESLNNRIMSKTADSGIDEQQRQANEWRGPHTNPDTAEVYYCGGPGPELSDNFVNKQRIMQLENVLNRIISAYDIARSYDMLHRACNDNLRLSVDKARGVMERIDIPPKGCVMIVDTPDSNVWRGAMTVNDDGKGVE